LGRSTPVQVGLPNVSAQCQRWSANAAAFLGSDPLACHEAEACDGLPDSFAVNCDTCVANMQKAVKEWISESIQKGERESSLGRQEQHRSRGCREVAEYWLGARAGVEVAAPNEKGGVLEETIEAVEGIVGGRGREGRSALIPLLQRVQEEVGYIPPHAISGLSTALRIPESEIYGVVTFYAQFRLEPKGRNLVKVCRGTACHVLGSGRILSRLEDHLNIRAGESTGDLEFSLEEIRCFGSCSLAPVMVINDDTYGRLTPAMALQIVERYRGNAEDNPELPEDQKAG
jgi:NADH-quinone oxidoreductase subunit E